MAFDIYKYCGALHLYGEVQRTVIFVVVAP